MTAPEVFFYHIERQPLESVLPSLLERTLERGWRALVHCGDPERIEALDSALWTYREDSFLPHGVKKDGYAADQPIYLTAEDDNPNGAGVCFLVAGAIRGNVSGFVRVIHLFDGRDGDAVAHAREQWKAAKAAGFPVTYWRQGDDGRWTKMG